jgi:hypothetical protein
MKDEFLALYKRDFKVTSGSKMETFLCMVVEQKDKCIKIHVDKYVKEVIAEYTGYIKKLIRPKKVPTSLAVALKAEDVPELPDPTRQKHYRLFVAKLQFAATWIRFHISFAVLPLARFCASAGPA